MQASIPLLLVVALTALARATAPPGGVRPVACARVGELDRRIADCTAVIASHAGPAERSAAFFDRAGAYAAKGDTDHAIADFSATITLAPNNAAAYQNRGLMYDTKGDAPRAIADFDQALRLQPDDPAALLNRGGAFARTGAEAQALADLGRAIAIAPRFPFPYIARAALEIRRGRLDEARADVAAFRQLRPDDSEGVKAEAAIRAQTIVPAK